MKVSCLVRDCSAFFIEEAKQLFNLRTRHLRNVKHICKNNNNNNNNFNLKKKGGGGEAAVAYQHVRLVGKDQTVHSP